MKHLAFSSFLFLLAMNCCSNEEIINNNTNANYEKRISVVVEDLTPANSTRTTYTESGNGYHFAWTEGDALGIFPKNGYQTAFPIVEGKGVGTNTAVFDGGDWALKANKSYAAYYPLVDKLSIDYTAIPVDYTGQVQNGNGATAHLSTYDYMASSFTAVDTKGNVNFKLQHLGCLVLFKLTMPETDSYSALEITSNNTPFITSGEYSLSDKDHPIENVQTSQTITIGLNNVATTAEENVLTIAAMFAPVDLSDSKLALKVSGNKKEYTLVLDGQNLAQGKVVHNDWDIPYVTFQAEALQTLKMSSAVDKLEYSVNGGAWMLLGTNIVTFGGNNGDLRLRGSNGTGTGKAWNSYSRVIFGTNAAVKCSGDIRTLADYKDYLTEDTTDDMYNVLFEGCISLTSAPQLPAMSLAENCYSEMFAGCTNLTTAPVLPATTLTVGCYSGMFADCTSLTTAPALPATILGAYCYGKMFIDCTNLTAAPVLPATTLAEGCYSGMFADCTSLTTAPALPATTLTDRCYEYMFSNCTNLTVAAALPATQLKPECYSGMFLDCNNLTTAPELPATILADRCYAYMFYGCTKLKSITVGFTNWYSDNGTYSWLDNVASTGTFKCPAELNTTIRYSSRIPEGWTVMTEHETVDLGLSVKWASVNIGASTPEDYGDYYAWGETETKSQYSWNNYRWNKNNYNSIWLTKYCCNSNYGTYDGLKELEDADDVAKCIWGESWGMPTRVQLAELVNFCDWEWTTLNGVPGYKITGSTGKSIFLPAAGSFSFLIYSNEGYGYYRPKDFISDRLYYLSFSPTEIQPNDFPSKTMMDDIRYLGFPVRAVNGEGCIAATSVSLNTDRLTLQNGQSGSFSATVLPSNASNRRVTWSSSDPSIVSVSKDGQVLAKSLGWVEIRAYVAGSSLVATGYVIVE